MPKHPCATSGLGDFHPPYRLWSVAPFQQLLLDAFPVILAGTAAAPPPSSHPLQPLPCSASTRAYARVMFFRATTASMSAVSSGLDVSSLAVTFDAPALRSPRGFRPLSARVGLGLLSHLSASPAPSKGKDLASPASCSGLQPRSHDLLCPLLTSALLSHRLATTVAHGQSSRSPRVMRTHFHAYACHIYARSFRAGIGL